MNFNFMVSMVLAMLASIIAQTTALYGGFGGVVGKNLTPRTGPSFPARSAASFSTSGRSRSRDYGVKYTNGYRPSNIRPFSSKGRRR